MQLKKSQVEQLQVINTERSHQFFSLYLLVFLLIFFSKENIGVEVNVFRDKKNRNPLYLDFFEKKLCNVL